MPLHNNKLFALLWAGLLLCIAHSGRATPTSPQITSLTPASGIPLQGIITISGTGFNDTAARNIVYFGAVAGSVVEATSSQLKVSVPVGAVYSTITVINLTTHLSCHQSGLFLPYYNNSCFVPGSNGFRPRTDVTLTGTSLPQTGPQHTALGDLDGDGKPELVVSTYDTIRFGISPVFIYKNTSSNGIISFAAPVICSSGAGGKNVRLADLDGDGKLDIIVACSGSGVISCIRNTTAADGPLTFAPKADLHPHSGCPEVAIADYDGDGKADIAAVSYSTSCVKLFRNRMTSIPVAAFPSSFFGGAGVYDSFVVGSAGVGAAPGSIFSADFDNDGLEDIVTANSGDMSVSVLRNQSVPGTMSFAGHVEFDHTGLPTEVQAADIDGDGRVDIVAADYFSSNVCIYANSAIPGFIDNGSFNRVNITLKDSSFGLNIGDLDGDGKPEIVISRGKGNSLAVLKNNSVSGAIIPSAFTTGELYYTGSGSEPQGFCIGDIDGDMKPDITTANFGNNKVSIFKNTSTPVSSPVAGTDSVCVLSSVLLHSPHCSNASAYWSVSNGHATIVAGSGAGDTAAVITGVSAGPDTVTCAIVSLYDTAFSTFVIAVKALADTGFISGPSALCAAASVTLTNTATGGIWSSGDTSVAHIDAVTGALTAVGAGNTFIYYTNQSVSCGPLAASHPLLVNPRPDAGAITGPDGTCVGSAISLTESVSGGQWINMYPLTAAQVPSGITNTIIGHQIGADTILYAVSTPTCGSDTAFKPIGIVAADIALPIAGDTFVCVHDSVQLFNPANGGTWSTDDPLVATVDAATGFVTGVAAGTVHISYVVAYSCGPVDTFVTFTVNPLPVPATVSGPGYVCMGGQVTLTASGGSDPGVWSSSDPAVSVVNIAGVVSAVGIGTDTVFYTLGNSCGTVSSYLPDTVRALPPVDSVTGAVPICPGATLTLTSTGGGISGTWNTSDATIATVTTGVVTALNSGNVIISYTVSTMCGLLTDTASVLVYPTPVVTATPDLAVCNNGTFVTIFTSTVPGTVFAWNNIDTSIGLVASGIGDTILFTAHNFTDSVVPSLITINPAANGCPGLPDTFQLSVEPTPLLTDIAMHTICDSTAFIYTPASTTVNVSYEWSRAAVAGIANPAAADTADINEVLFNSTSLPVVVSYVYTLTVNGCTNEQVVNVTVQPRPVLISTLTPPDICSHTLFSYSPATSFPGATVVWHRPSVSGLANLPATGSDNPNEVLMNTTALTIAVPYTFTVNAYGCSYAQVVTVNVKPKAFLNSATSDTICSGAPFHYTAVSSLPGTAYAWIRHPLPGITPAADSGTVNIGDTLLNGTFTRLNAVYVYTLTANGCSYLYNVVLTVDPVAAPAPVITTHSPASVCANTLYQNFGTATTPADTAVQYVWTSSNAVVYATGPDDQYSLVNFMEPGNAVVTVTGNVRGISCYVKDTFAVSISSSYSDMPTVLYFNNTQFVCLPSDEDSYQWGYDDEQLDSTLLTGEINQDYINTSPDFSKYYWCITSRKGCIQKTYYKIPLAVDDINGRMATLKLFPNPATNRLNVELSDVSIAGTSVEIYDMVGRKVLGSYLANRKTVLDISELDPGVYTVACYDKQLKITSAKFIKN